MLMRSRSRPRFQGDVSEWGRSVAKQGQEEQEQEERPFCGRNRPVDDSNDDSDSMCSSLLTLSSGMSPRGLRTRQPFDPAVAAAALAGAAGQYSRAQSARRRGCAELAGLGSCADDLPTRVAYQQLAALAGMAGKVRIKSMPRTNAHATHTHTHTHTQTHTHTVAPHACACPQVQDAILHNKRMFEQRMLQQDRALQRQAFSAWTAVHAAAAAKAARQQRATARVARGVVSRVFFSWRDELHLVDRTLAMRRRVCRRGERGNAAGMTSVDCHLTMYWSISTAISVAVQGMHMLVACRMHAVIHSCKHSQLVIVSCSACPSSPPASMIYPVCMYRR
jgi:hypothetical protein